MFNLIPSVVSKIVDVELPSSNEITPSLPTFSRALAIICPGSESLPADIVATCSIAARSSTGSAKLTINSTKYLVAFSIPRFNKIGFAPAATFRIPCLTIEYAKTVAVVVPSPATSFVFAAAWRINNTPVFSMLSTNSICFAILTPSFIISGDPNLFSITTFRPFGPNVTATASVNIPIPFSNARLASSW